MKKKNIYLPPQALFADDLLPENVLCASLGEADSSFEDYSLIEFDEE